jgi:drug/metabolite transporter (DMT)-like permease
MALDRGRVAIVQPLLVTTVVFALPLGYFLTHQHVGMREVVGSGVIVAGLALFTVFGDPAGGKDNAPGAQWLIVIVILSIVVAILLPFGKRGDAGQKAAVYGTASGIMFGLAAALAKPTVEELHNGLSAVLSDWETYALLAAGAVAFILQQISLGTGHLAPSVATVSVANPVIGILIGTLLLDERLARPTWHVALALIGLGCALAGAVAISMSTGGAEAPEPARLHPADDLAGV